MKGVGAAAAQLKYRLPPTTSATKRNGCRALHHLSGCMCIPAERVPRICNGAQRLAGSQSAPCRIAPGIALSKTASARPRAGAVSLGHLICGICLRARNGPLAGARPVQLTFSPNILKRICDCAPRRVPQNCPQRGKFSRAKVHSDRGLRLSAARLAISNEEHPDV
jgi:hypothetical protein